MTNAPIQKSSDSFEQDQFLSILSREDALARFEAELFPRSIASEWRPLADALGQALAADVVSPIDVPPFDRSNVDGFAVRSADLASAATPVSASFSTTKPSHAALHRCSPSHRERRPRLRPGDRCRVAPMLSRWSSIPSPSVTARSRSAVQHRQDNSCPMPAPTLRAARRCCALEP